MSHHQAQPFAVTGTGRDVSCYALVHFFSCCNIYQLERLGDDLAKESSAIRPFQHLQTWATWQAVLPTHHQLLALGCPTCTVLSPLQLSPHPSQPLSGSFKGMYLHPPPNPAHSLSSYRYLLPFANTHLKARFNPSTYNTLGSIPQENENSDHN